MGWEICWTYRTSCSLTSGPKPSPVMITFPGYVYTVFISSSYWSGSIGSDIVMWQSFLQLLQNGHCSVLIKALPGFENIFASHSRLVTPANTRAHNYICMANQLNVSMRVQCTLFPYHCSWFVYSSMNRIYKHYALRIRNG